MERLSLNQATIPGWTLSEAAEGCARAGLGWIGVWRDRLAEVGVEAGARAIRDAGLRVSGLCRGGWFDAASPAERQARMDDNLRALEEAALLGTSVLVLVCGPAAARDLATSRAYVREAVGRLSEHSAACGVTLGIEPLHPMYCGDRSVVVTLAQALEMAGEHPLGRVGVVADTYHVWWDPQAMGLLEGAAERLVGFHVADWLVPTPDLLNGRGMPGDGVIDIRSLRRAADRSYGGPIEVEIFNAEVWQLPPDDCLALVKQRYAEHVLG